MITVTCLLLGNIEGTQMRTSSFDSMRVHEAVQEAIKRDVDVSRMSELIKNLKEANCARRINDIFQVNSEGEFVDESEETVINLVQKWADLVVQRKGLPSNEGEYIKQRVQDTVIGYFATFCEVLTKKYDLVESQGLKSKLEQYILK